MYCYLSLLIQLIILMGASSLITICFSFIGHRIIQITNKTEGDIDHMPKVFEVILDILDNVFSYSINLVTIF